MRLEVLKLHGEYELCSMPEQDESREQYVLRAGRPKIADQFQLRIKEKKKIVVTVEIFECFIRQSDMQPVRADFELRPKISFELDSSVDTFTDLVEKVMSENQLKDNYEFRHLSRDGVDGYKNKCKMELRQRGESEAEYVHRVGIPDYSDKFQMWIMKKIYISL